MKSAFTKYKRSAIAIVSIIACVFLFAKCVSNDDKTVANNAAEKKLQQLNNTATTYSQYAGSAACASCHKAIYDSFLTTSHNLTSTPATEHFIKGSFKPGKNSFAYAADHVVNMEKRDSGLYQVEYDKGVEKRSARFDISIGSGVIGQTYISFKDNYLYEMPVSYFSTVADWVNSPGYPGKVIFSRPVTARCMECHSTFATVAESKNTSPDVFNKSQVLMGVGCEKCHGPAAAHVAFQTKNPTVKQAKFIINPNALNRQLHLDVCALCHAGGNQKTTLSFSFTAGDTLSHFFRAKTTPSFSPGIDVHGNQYGLLAMSKCFKNSQVMTCNSCHSAHADQRGNLAAFSQRCVSCHTTAHAPVDGVEKATLTNNCIDCHMPLETSKSIAFLLKNSEVPTAALMRTHVVAIYPNETAKFIAAFKNASEKK